MSGLVPAADPVSIGCSVARKVTRLSLSSWTMFCGSRNDSASRSMRVTTRQSPGRRKPNKCPACFLGKDHILTRRLQSSALNAEVLVEG
jgi:hypothetical protein